MGRVLIGEEAPVVSDQWIASSPSRPRNSRQEILQVRPVERRPPAVADSRRASRAGPGGAGHDDRATGSDGTVSMRGLAADGDRIGGRVLTPEGLQSLTDQREFSHANLQQPAAACFAV